MIGLIKKDLFIIKNNLKIILILFIVFFITGLQNSTDMSYMPITLSVVLFLSTFSYDEYNKWDAYAITLPNGRVNIVKSKYIATIILVLITSLISFILNLLTGYINNSINFEETLSMITGITFSIILIQSISYPIIFKFGIEKGRLLLFASIFIIISLISLIPISINISSNIILFIEKYWIILLLIITSIILSISYLISKKIYLKKEF